MSPLLERLIAFWRTIHTPAKTYGRVFDDNDLWDCYLLAVRENKDLELDLYVWMCGDATLVFPDVRSVRWLQKHMKPNIDPDGSVDYGTLESLEREENGSFRLYGEFGEIVVESAYPFMRYAKDFTKW